MGALYSVDFAGWIFASEEDREQRLALLKCTQCPHCKHSGALNRHGSLRGYDEQSFRQKAVRALRVFCSNRGSNQGCGRTFSVWIAGKVKRLSLDAKDLWDFLHHAATTGNKSQAFQKIRCAMDASATYRIWKRFLQAQSGIRTALTSVCSPPRSDALAGFQSVAQATVAHLKEAFKDETLNPIAAYQVQTQSFFI